MNNNNNKINIFYIYYIFIKSTNDDDVYVAPERANRVVVRLNEEDLDNAMNEDVPNNDQRGLVRANNLNDMNINAITRDFLNANPQYGVINIQDFLNNPHVIHNPSGENYATSLQILLPWAETVTPMVAQSIKIYKLDENNNPEEVLDTLSMDDATLVGEGESFEVNKGDVVFMAQKEEEDNPATTDKDEKKWYQKFGAFVCNGAKTIWNGAKDTAVWIWNHGGEEIAEGALKVGVGIGVDYLTGGSGAATAGAIAGVASQYLNGSRAPVAVEAPVAESTKGQLIPWSSRNDNMRSRTTRAFPDGYPDITDVTDLYFNPERLIQVSKTIITMPIYFWHDLLNKKVESQRLLAERQLARRLLLQQQKEEQETK